MSSATRTCSPVGVHTPRVIARPGESSQMPGFSGAASTGIGRHVVAGGAVGCALALPRPVWDSWQPFLGAPDLHQHADGTWRLLDDQASQPSDWIYVFDIDTQPAAGGLPAPIRVDLVIGTDAATLSRAAFEVAPTRAVEHGGDVDAVITTIARRLGRYIPGIR